MDRRKTNIRVCAFVAIWLIAAFFEYAPAVHAAWTEPNNAPPYGNVAAPLNVSSTDQTKTGGLTIQGGMIVSNELKINSLSALQATAPTPSNETTIAVAGVGSLATNTSDSSIGVYGITSSNPDGSGAHYGVVGIAAFNNSNAVGVYGWDNGNENAYAGYFLGRTTIKGGLSVTHNDYGAGGFVGADSFCLLGNCQTSWASLSPQSWLFQEFPPGNTFLANTSSSLRVGGRTDENTSFLFRVGDTRENSIMYSPGSIVLGEPSKSASGDGICQADETCNRDNPDCWGQQATCESGFLCDLQGSGECLEYDLDPPVGGMAYFPQATPSNIVCRRGVAEDSISGVRDYHFYYRKGTYTANEQDYSDLGYSNKPDYINITNEIVQDADYTCVVRARDWAGNEQAFSVAPHATTRTPDTPCETDNDCVGTNTPVCCDGFCEESCSGGGGSSPAILKDLYEGGDECPPGQPDCMWVREDATQPKQRSVFKSLRGVFGRAGLWFADQFTKASFPIRSPEAFAAGSFGGTDPVRLTIHNGVLRFVSSSAIEMEIGNNGTDIASTGKIYIRPESSTQGSYFSGQSNKQNLTLTGNLEALGNISTSNNGKIRENDLPVLSMATIAAGDGMTCANACAAVGKTCWVGENASALITLFCTCSVTGRTWVAGALCLCY
jgi:hypothetical protein